MNDTFVIDLLHILINICLNDTFVIDLLHILVNICLNDTFVIDLLHIFVNICFNGFGGGLRPPHPRPSGRLLTAGGRRPVPGVGRADICRPPPEAPVGTGGHL